MIDVDGVPTERDLKNSAPSEDRIRRKPVALHECYQDIPCDPCVYSCPVNAITMKTLISIPEINHEKCTGCSACVAACPGIAIFMVEKKDEDGFVTLAYEFVPLPAVGELVDGLDRRGCIVCEASVSRVFSLPGIDKKTKTTLVRLRVPAQKVMEVRFFRRRVQA